MANINSVGAVTQAQGQQSVNQQANKAAEAAAKAKKEREAIIDKAPTLELKQCALMSTLFSSDYLYGHHYKNQDGKLWSNRIIGFLGGGKSNPAEVNNYFTCDNKIKFYYDGGTVQAGFFKDLYYTFLDADGKAKEIRLKQSSLSTSDAIFNLTEKLSLALNDYVSRGSPPGLGIPVTGYGTFANAQDLRRAIRTANAKKEEENLAFEAIKDVGAGGPFLGCDHTQKNFKSAFWRSDILNYKPFETWQEEGEKDLTYEANKKAKTVGSVYIFTLNQKYDINGKVSWNLAKYINHSCDPNCETDIIKGRIWISAIKDIKKGEELSYDYGYDMYSFEDHPCRCGSKNCIGYIVRSNLRWRLKKKLMEKRK